MTALLQLHQACLGQRLQPITLTLRADQRVVLLGASGAGKTTLLKLCNGALSPDSGFVHWCGRPHQQLSRRQRRLIGTLWQDLRLVEELSVIQNINSGALAWPAARKAAKTATAIGAPSFAAKILAAVTQEVPNDELEDHLVDVAHHQRGS